MTDKTERALFEAWFGEWDDAIPVHPTDLHIKNLCWQCWKARAERAPVASSESMAALKGMVTRLIDARYGYSRNVLGKKVLAAIDALASAPVPDDRIKRIADAWNSLDPEHKIAVEYSNLFDAINDAARAAMNDPK